MSRRTQEATTDELLAEMLAAQERGKAGVRLLQRVQKHIERESKAKDSSAEQRAPAPSVSPASPLLRRLRLTRGRASAAQKRINAGCLALADVKAGKRPSWDREAMSAQFDYESLRITRDQNERDAIDVERAMLAAGEPVEPWADSTLEPNGAPMNETEMQAARDQLAKVRRDADALEALFVAGSRIPDSVAGRVRDAAWSMDAALWQAQKGQPKA